MDNESAAEEYFSHICTQPPSIFEHIENNRPDLINSPGTVKPKFIQAQPLSLTKKYKLDRETILISINYQNIKLNSERDINLVISIISASTATKPDLPHKCYNILLGRIKVVRKKCGRVKITTDMIKLPLKDYIPVSMLGDPIVLRYIVPPHSWLIPQLAKCICNFDNILIQAI